MIGSIKTIPMARPTVIWLLKKLANALSQRKLGFRGHLPRVIGIWRQRKVAIQPLFRSFKAKDLPHCEINSGKLTLGIIKQSALVCPIRPPVMYKKI